MGCSSALETFKINNESCLSAKDDHDSKVPKINDRDNDRKISCWSYIFKHYLSNSHGLRGPLVCVFREDLIVTDEVMGLLLDNYCYGESRTLISELESLLPRSEPIFKNDDVESHVKI